MLIKKSNGIKVILYYFFIKLFPMRNLSFVLKFSLLVNKKTSVFFTVHEARRHAYRFSCHNENIERCKQAGCLQSINHDCIIFIETRCHPRWHERIWYSEGGIEFFSADDLCGLHKLKKALYYCWPV